MRNNFNSKLQTLNDNLSEICKLCERSLDSSLNAISGEELSTSANLELKTKIEDQCLNLLREENPVASNFRVIIATLLMVADLSRITIQSHRINTLAQILNKKGIKFDDIGLTKLAKSAIENVKDTVQCVVSGDLDLATKIINGDEGVDDAFNEVKENLAKLMLSIPESGELLIDLVLIAKYYERISDHSVNVARLMKFQLNGSDK
ncbi:MAG: PhoU domain-containing protein [Succinivibrionaceae bacterium]|nr:PhoU domain-containing protein [Succinivibrionaceae bacterium]